MSLRSRLLLLVVASVVPLVGMGLIREYLDYQVAQRETYDDLLLTARGMSVGLERDLQLHVSSLETLATSPALQASDLTGFDGQAARFWRGSRPGPCLAWRRNARRRCGFMADLMAVRRQWFRRRSGGRGNPVFETGQPVVTNLLREESDTGIRRATTSMCLSFKREPSFTIYPSACARMASAG